MKTYRKATMSPAAWARRMAMQRDRRARPEIRERINARARELWPTSEKKQRAKAYQKARRAKGACAAADARRRERMKTNKPLAAKRKASQRLAYWKRRHHYIAKEAKRRRDMTPSYCAQVLHAPVEQMTPELVQLVQSHLRLKRTIHEKTTKH